MISKTALMATVSTLSMLIAPLAYAQSMDELVAAANAEGRLTTIALPHSWCGYGAVIAQSPGLGRNFEACCLQGVNEGTACFQSVDCGKEGFVFDDDLVYVVSVGAGGGVPFRLRFEQRVSQ